MPPRAFSPAVLAFVTGALALHLAAPRDEPGRLFTKAPLEAAIARRAFEAVPEKYRKPPQEPPLFTGTTTSIISDSIALINGSTELYDRLVAEVKPENATFENAMLPINWDDSQWAIESNILYFYQYVSADEQLRGASVNASTLMDQFGIEIGQREDVFLLVDAVFNKLDTAEKGLDAESRRLVEKTRKGFISSGLGIPAGEKRARFKAIQQRKSELDIEFNRNLNEESGGVWFALSELEGLPTDVIEQYEKGTGENAGKVRMTFKSPDYNPMMRFAVNPETRRKAYVASENRNAQNSALLRETVVLRDEAARLLGYPNHAAYILEDRMAHNVETVLSFLNDLKTRLSRSAAKEFESFMHRKQNDLAAKNASWDGYFYLWDLGYYSRLQIEGDYDVDQTKVAEYFPVQSTVAAMLKIFEELFGFVFVEVPPEERASLSPTGKGPDLTWHEEVIFFSVWDSDAEGGGFVGYLYLDLHPRPGKYGHAANFNLQAGYVTQDGKTRRRPATALVCNLSKPTPNRPGLLRHEEVVTLFHELGHGIHDLSGRTRYSRFHGTRTVRDFVEAPSQMLENWCWTPSSLKRLSSHYQTGASIPDDLVEKLIATKHVNEATGNIRQIHYGLFDMGLHTPATHADAEKIDTSALYNTLRAEMTGMKGMEVLGGNSTWGHGDGSFGHMMGGYDAGYYGYLWSQVYSLDMFYTAFKANPMDATIGHRYRHTVLERGGSQDEMLTLEQFLGRKPNSEAFYKELGVS